MFDGFRNGFNYHYYYYVVNIIKINFEDRTKNLIMTISSKFILFCGFFACQSYAANVLEAEIQTLADSFMVKSGYVGLSVTAKSGSESLFHYSFGYSDAQKTQRFSAETTVALGSNTKVVTAALIHELAEQGTLDLNKPVNHYLNSKVRGGDDVSLSHLLCHTSGMPNVFGEGEFEYYLWQKASSNAELVAKINSSRQVIKPGDTYHYNNTGYLLLGWVIEQVNGTSLGDYVRANFINRLSLPDTYYLGDSVHIPNMSDGFTVVDDNVAVVPYDELIEYRVVGGAGALGGSLIDYIDWFSTIASGRFLSASATQTMQTPCILNSGDVSPEAMGIEWTEVNGEKALSGGGVVNGFLALAYYFPKYDLTIGFVGNTETDWLAFYKGYFPLVVDWVKQKSNSGQSKIK